MGAYLVMNTFSGRYLAERSNKNIGHENINFFLPDNAGDNFLLWFNSDGIINSRMRDFDGRITLLMVTNFANAKDKFRVLAIARNCHIVDGATVPSQKEEAKNERHTRFMNQFPNASFGNKTLERIYLDNTYRGKSDGNNTLATLFTDKHNVFVPEDPNFTIQIKKVDGSDIYQNMANEKMRMFVEDDASFESLINDSIRWLPFDDELQQLPRFPKRSEDYKERKSFFAATGNEKDELTLSNIISYSLSNSVELLNAFVTGLVGGENEQSGEYIVKREDKHVDLTVLLEDKTIIVENKIDSTIVKYDRDKEELKKKILKVYKEYKPGGPKTRADARERYEEKVRVYGAINRLIDHYLDQISDTDDICQLTKYYIQSKIDAYLSDREDEPIHYFFLVPNYTANKFDIDENGCVRGYAFSDNYHLITYSQLFEIFSSVSDFDYREDILNEFAMLSEEIDDFDQKRQIYSFLKRAGL